MDEAVTATPQVASGHPPEAVEKPLVQTANFTRFRTQLSTGRPFPPTKFDLDGTVEIVV
jgi:hypothetical protein